MKKTFLFMAKLENSGADSNVYPTALLVGDETYFLGEDVFVPTEEIARAAPTMEGQPVLVNHSHSIEDEVGFMRNVRMDGKTLRGELVLNPDTVKYPAAKAFIENRFAAGKTPETSVGVFMEVSVENDVLVARALSFDHNALVTRGACSPETGCGVGLCRHAQETHTMSETTTKKTDEMENDEAEKAEETTAQDEIAQDTGPAPASPEPEPDEDDDEEEDEEREEQEATAACSCGGAEALAAARAEATELKTLARDVLRPQAEALGLQVAADECVKTLRSRIADAERVAAHLGKAAPAHERGARRHSKSASTDPKSRADALQDEALRILRAGNPRAYRDL